MNIEKHLLSLCRQGLDTYHMLSPGDKVAVGVSGGKDSLCMLWTLKQLSRFYPVPFELCAVAVDLGFPSGTDWSAVEDFCKTIEVPFSLEKTDIYTIVFDVRKEKSPCSLCAKLRRGALNEKAKALGCNTVALGHHRDDFTDTYVMNLLLEGHANSFDPVTHLSRVGVKVIRPMLLVPEKDIIAFTKIHPLPVIPSSCPANDQTQRATVNEMLNTFDRSHPGTRHRILLAIQEEERTRNKDKEDIAEEK